MTNEEAIKVLNMVEAHGLAEEAKQMAISALNSLEKVYAKGYNDGFTQAEINFENDKALSQEPCDDAISRKDAEQMFRNIRCHLKPQDYKSAEEFNTRDLMLLNAEQMIHALPSVTQKSGKWILLDECANSGYYCSECHKKLVKEGWSNTVKKINFCPNCGAKMERGEKE